MENHKTLVIILSETRASEITFSSFKRNVVDILNADVCVCIGVKDDYDYSNPFYQLAKYRFIYDEPSDYADAFDYAASVICPEDGSVPWRQYLIVKDQFMGGVKDAVHQHTGSAGILIFFRWFLLQKLNESGIMQKYDRFIITRSDFYYRMPHPDITMMNDNFIWIPDGEQYGGYTDRHVVLSRNNIASYLNILENMIKSKDTSNAFYNKMTTHHEWNLEKLIKYNLIFNGVDGLVRYMPYIMYSVRAVTGTTRWSVGTYNEHLNCFIKYQTEYDTSYANCNTYSAIYGSNETKYYASIFLPTPNVLPGPIAAKPLFRSSLRFV